jgi:hypothetical protein
MKKYAAIVAAVALVASTGIASAQSRNYDSSGAPKSARRRRVAAAGWPRAA